MTQTMIERIARAVWQHERDTNQHAELFRLSWYEPSIRAALEAMKEPTKAMLQRMPAYRPANHGSEVNAAKKWQFTSMIDAALQENQPMPSDTTNFDRIMEGLQEVVEIEAGLKDAATIQNTRTGYMCLIDFDHELESAAGGNLIYPSLEDLKANHPMWAECGVVKVTVTRTETVVPQDLSQCVPVKS